jgi:hypothetical protein
MRPDALLDTGLPADPFPDWQQFAAALEVPTTGTHDRGRPAPYGVSGRIGVNAVSVSEAIVAAFLAAQDDIRASV